MQLQNFFYNSTSLIIHVNNPSEQEIEEFFGPMFFGSCPSSISSILKSNKQGNQQTIIRKSKEHIMNNEKSHRVLRLRQNGRICKLRSPRTSRTTPEKSRGINVLNNTKDIKSLYTFSGNANMQRSLCTILTTLLRRSIGIFSKKAHKSSDTRLQNVFGDSPGTRSVDN